MPLLWASYQGYLDVADVLVKAGAALSATDKARSHRVLTGSGALSARFLSGWRSRGVGLH
jgi:ankyrin repeat protein